MHDFGQKSHHFNIYKAKYGAIPLLFIPLKYHIFTRPKQSERYMDAAPTGDDNEKQYGISIHN